ncbi:MAG: hypothetical protein NXI07_15050, partial [bacterium]|nr:hypothetical protein [bacterium]
GIHDARVAFFHARLGPDEVIWVRPPRGLRRPGMLWRLYRALYGTRKASKLWGQLVRDTLQAKDFTALPVAVNLYHHASRAIQLGCHGDDFVSCSTVEQQDWLDGVLADAFDIKCVGRIGPGCAIQGKVLKRLVTWDTEGFTWIGDVSHVENLVQMLGLQDAKPMATSGSRETGKSCREALDTLGPAEAALARAAAGLCQYIAHDRPDIAFAVKNCLTAMASPNRLMMMRLVRIARYLKGKPALAWKYPYQQDPKNVTSFADADFAGDDFLRSTSAVADFHGCHPIDFAATTQSVRALSTGEAEFYAIVKAGASVILSRQLMDGFGMSGTATVRSDATAGIGIARRSGSGRLKHLQV